MSEITKLYENAGVKPLPTCNNCYMLDEYWSNGTYCSTCKCDKDNDECNMASYQYPPFTAEKQILLIQWLLDKTDLYLHRHKTDFTYSIASGNYAVNKYKDFEESIAEFINAIWQDLTEEEKQQIKEILNEQRYH